MKYPWHQWRFQIEKKDPSFLFLIRDCRGVYWSRYAHYSGIGMSWFRLFPYIWALVYATFTCYMLQEASARLAIVTRIAF